MIPSITGGRRVAANDPTLRINFKECEQAVDPRVVCSGGSSGTRLGVGGLIIPGTEVCTDFNRVQPNICLRSEDFNHVAWVTKSGLSVTVDAVAAPAALASTSGAATADKLVESALNEQHYIEQDIVSNAQIAQGFSVYLKAAGRTAATVVIYDWSGTSNNLQMTVNLTTGAVTSGPTAAGSAIVTSSGVDDAGGGWWRIRLAGVVGPNWGGSVRPRIHLNNGGIGYLGDGTSGIYATGAMVNLGTTCGTYAATTSVAAQAPAVGRGLVIEESKQNLAIANDDFTTNHSTSPALAVACTNNAFTAPDGTVTADKLTTGDTASNAHLWFRTSFAGAISTTYCGAMFLRAGEYTRAELSFDNTAFASVAKGALFNLATGAVVVTSANATSGIRDYGNGWFLCWIAATSDGDGGNYVFGVSPKPSSVSTFGASYTPASTGLGIYAWGEQIVVGSVPTLRIPTPGAAVTRSTRSAVITGTDFSSWFNPLEGTFVLRGVEVTETVNDGTARVVFGVSDGSATTNESIYIVRTANSAAIFLAVNDGGVSQVAGMASAGNMVVGTPSNIAFRYKLNDIAICMDGGTVRTDTSATLPVVDRAAIGCSPWAPTFNSLNGAVGELIYYPYAKTNAELQGLTR